MYREIDANQTRANAGSNSSREQDDGAACQAGSKQRLGRLLRGVFAGNIFDLGATASAKLFDEAGVTTFFFLCHLNEPKRSQAYLYNISIMGFAGLQHPEAALLLSL